MFPGTIKVDTPTTEHLFLFTLIRNSNEVMFPGTIKVDTPTTEHVFLFTFIKGLYSRGKVIIVLVSNIIFEN